MKAKKGGRGSGRGVGEGYFLLILFSFQLKCINSSRNTPATLQHAKKVMSDSPGLVDFAIGLVIFVLNLHDGQVLFLGKIQITEGL